MTMNDAARQLWQGSHWRRATLIIWLIFAAGLLFWYWGRVHWFALGDTDDNMRMMEVRAWLNGQGWYDLRQYRLSPPQGFNIHWSRLVDLPIAAIILAVKPFFGTAVAERAAIAIAAILPLFVVLFSLGLTVRRLIAPSSYAVAAFVLLGAGSTLSMFTPARIDHHGWQLAMVAMIMAGLADPKARRGGATVGIASALSLVIGFEMMPYLALAGIAIVLRWVLAADQSRRLQTYGVALAGGSAFGFAIFASNDNWQPLCDVLSPPWMSTMVLAGGLLFMLGRLPLRSPSARLVAAAAAAALLGGFMAVAWPQCLGRPEGVSDELQREWLNNIREARPITVQDWRIGAMMIALPAVGLIGGILAALNARHDRDWDRLATWGSIALLSVCGFALLFFQIRAAAAAQLLAIPFAVYLIWTIVPLLRASENIVVRVIGVALMVFAASGLLVPLALQMVPKAADKPVYAAVRKAGASCSTIPAMAPLDRVPRATILTMVDLGPRLITLTHHDAIAGPYHRNGEQILDVHRAFEGNEANARRIARKYGATMLLICPNFPEATVYRSKAPKGFYAGLERGTVPAWLEPVKLPATSPFKLWRIKP
jgi:hypothetical protein